MAVEIERKFLVTGDEWRADASPGQRISQGYLSGTRPGWATVRIRRAGPTAYLTIKGPEAGRVRSEFEYEISGEEAEEMPQMCRRPLITKVRHAVSHAGKTWSVDVFEGANSGLVLAEIELSHRDEQVQLPTWVGREVTDDPRYRNSALVDRPIGRGWSKVIGFPMVVR